MILFIVHYTVLLFGKYKVVFIDFVLCVIKKMASLFQSISSLIAFILKSISSMSKSVNNVFSKNKSITFHFAVVADLTAFWWVLLAQSFQSSSERSSSSIGCDSHHHCRCLAVFVLDIEFSAFFVLFCLLYELVATTTMIYFVTTHKRISSNILFNFLQKSLNGLPPLIHVTHFLVLKTVVDDPPSC